MPTLDDLSIMKVKIVIANGSEDRGKLPMVEMNIIPRKGEKLQHGNETLNIEDVIHTPESPDHKCILHVRRAANIR